MAKKYLGKHRKYKICRVCGGFGTVKKKIHGEWIDVACPGRCDNGRIPV